MSDHTEISWPHRTTDLVEYQDGSIVSRVVVKSPAGNVSVFAFDEGQELSEHTVPHEALVVVLDGVASITVDGVDHELTAGDAIPLPAGRPHAVRATKRFKMMLTILRAPGAR